MSIVPFGSALNTKDDNAMIARSATIHDDRNENKLLIREAAVCILSSPARRNGTTLKMTRIVTYYRIGQYLIT